MEKLTLAEASNIYYGDENHPRYEEAVRIVRAHNQEIDFMKGLMNDIQMLKNEKGEK